MPFVETQIDLKIIIASEISQRKTNTTCITYMWNLKKKNETNELIYSTERDSDIKNKLVATKRER